MGLNELIIDPSTKEQREKLLKLNPDLVAWVYSLISQKSNTIELKLVDSVLACYPNNLEGLKWLDKKSEITIINLLALRKWKVENLFWNKIHNNDLVLLSNWVIEIVEAKDKSWKIKLHLITTLRDWWAADVLQRTTTAGRNSWNDLREDLEREHIEESPFLWRDKNWNFALATIDDSEKSIEILKESITFFLNRKYLNPWDENYNFAKRTFERNFPWIEYDNLGAILRDIINNNRVFTYSVEEGNSLELLVEKDNIKELSLWESRWRYFVYFDTNNNTIEYRLLRKIIWFNNWFTLLSKRPSRLFLESQNQYPRIQRIENIINWHVPTIKFFWEEVRKIL